MNSNEIIRQSRTILEEADGLFILAGAGMGVDSGLPDFRGNEGFWRAYPVVKKLGLAFEEMANPVWFERDPALAWAFYGHRLHLYRDTIPHRGFDSLLELGRSKRDGYFVFTSNVDGQFQKAGFEEERVMECHGSIHHLQCIDNCQGATWSAEGTDITIDEDFQAVGDLPHCPWCGRLARPNILMFGDYGWDYQRTDDQRKRLTTWLNHLASKGSKLAIIELGAGTAIPTVRSSAQRTAKEFNTPLIRINPRESHDAPLPIELGAVDALALLLG